MYSPSTNAFPSPRHTPANFIKKYSLMPPSKSRRDSMHGNTPQRALNRTDIPRVSPTGSLRGSPPAHFFRNNRGAMETGKSNTTTIEPNGGVHYKEITIDSTLSNDEVRTPLSLFRPFYNHSQMRKEGAPIFMHL